MKKSKCDRLFYIQIIRKKKTKKIRLALRETNIEIVATIRFIEIGFAQGHCLHGCIQLSADPLLY